MDAPTCRKHGFRTKVDALIALTNIDGSVKHQRHAAEHPAPVRAYYHAACKRWHLTSMQLARGKAL